MSRWIIWLGLVLGLLLFKLFGDALLWREVTAGSYFSGMALLIHYLNERWRKT